MVYCGFPDEADRLAILQAVGRKLAPGVDIGLQDIAHVTQGFTGADLAAILSEAQLLAVHDQIDMQGSGGSQETQQQDQQQQQQQQQGVEREQGQGQQEEGEGEAAAAAACVLTAQHIQRALAKARPSLPVTEKRRLEAVYARFQQSRDPGLSNRPAVGDEDHTRVKHATLA
jgi:peroxin-1